MKKIVLGIGLVVVTLFGCSKSDDSENNGIDEIYSLEYKKLKDLDEIRDKVFYYAGIKVGNNKTSMLVPQSKSCRAQEFFSNAATGREPTLEFGYIKMTPGDFGCEPTVSAFFLHNRLVRDGVLQTTIKEGKLDPFIGIDLKDGEPWYKGNLEIGFQGEYLRIEDRMSTYMRDDPNEKVYLYFKR